MRKILLIKLALLFLLILNAVASAQTDEFTYQGKLTDLGTPSATYDFEFRLCTAESTGDCSIPTVEPNGVLLETKQRLGVTVSNGIFTVKLDFAASYFSGEDRFLEIRVRRNNGESWITLSPRQKITSSPYSIKSVSADRLSGACLSCVVDSQINTVSGFKITGQVFSAQQADFALFAQNVSGIVAIANGGTGSSTKNFVDLTTNQTVGGDKNFTGAVSVSGANGVFNGNGAGLTNLNGANIVADSVTPTQLSSETVPNSYNLRVLGSLRWDLLKSQRTFSLGIQPSGIAFDGANMWVVEFNGTTVKKIRASDGAILGTFPVGNALRYIAYDGANMWITSATPSTGVTKVRASDGAVLGSFPTSNAAFNLALDGENMWVLNGNNVTKFRTSDGANLGTFAAGSSPSGIAFDGAYMWITHSGAAGLKKLNVADGTSVDYPMATGGGTVFDGSNIWLANTTAGSLVKIRTLDGAILNSYPIASGANQVAFDGTHLWVINNDNSSGIATKVRAGDGAILASFALGALPIAMAFDGTNMWATNTNSNTVTRLPPAFQQ